MREYLYKNRRKFHPIGRYRNSEKFRKKCMNCMLNENGMAYQKQRSTINRKIAHLSECDLSEK